MAEINLDRVYATYIQIPENCEWERYINDILRGKVAPLISLLKEKEIIKWYGFHVHDRRSGKIPTTDDDHHAYVHIRLELTEGARPDDLENLLEWYCHYFPKISGRTYNIRDELGPRAMGKIGGVCRPILKDCRIEEAWQVIGECSEWVLKMLDAYSSDKEIPFDQVGQFLHFIANQLYLGGIIDNYPDQKERIRI